MFKLLTVLTAVTFLASAGWADDFDKSSSITLEKDASTGIWTVECVVTIKGLDGRGVYTVRAGHYLLPDSQIGSQFVLSPIDKIYNESSLGVYEIQARLTGQKLIVHAVYFHSPVYSNRTAACDMEVYPALPEQPDPIDVSMQIWLQDGEPLPP